MRQTQVFDRLLSQFHGKFNPESSGSTHVPEHERLLTDFESAHADWEREQFLFADDFNILRTMRLSRKELCHSNILAWLLDHRLEAFGTHAQGKSGFRLFLQRLGLPLEYAKTDYRVFREEPGEESTVDILIEAERRFVIGIENKVDAEEGEEQTRREWGDLVRRGKERAVLPSKITAFGRKPPSERRCLNNHPNLQLRNVLGFEKN